MGDTLRIQKAQMLMAGGVSEADAIKAIKPPSIPEGTWVAGGSALKAFFKTMQRSAWLNNDAPRAQLAQFAADGNDIANFPLTVDEQRTHIARQAAQRAAKGV